MAPEAVCIRQLLAKRLIVHTAFPVAVLFVPSAIIDIVPEPLVITRESWLNRIKLSYHKLFVPATPVVAYDALNEIFPPAASTRAFWPITIPLSAPAVNGALITL